MSTKKPRMELSVRLKQIKIELGLNQKEMSKKLGIAVSTYQYYERGERDIPAKIFVTLTTHGVNANWLLTGNGEMFSLQGTQDVIEFGPVVGEHIEVVKKFSNKETALEANKDLLDLEQYAPDAFTKAISYIKGLKDGISLSIKSKKKGRSGGNKFKKVKG